MLRPLIRALPSVIVDTEKVLREADGSVQLIAKDRARMERCSPRGAPQNRTVRASEEPEEHKRDKLCNDPEVSNRTNQLQTQIMIERCNPLLERTREPRKMEEERPVLRRSKHVLFTKKLSNMIERGNPLLNQEEPKHVHLMTARVSTLNWHMIERFNPLLKHTENVPDGSQTRSFHKSTSFNVGVETIRDRTEQPVVN